MREARVILVDDEPPARDKLRRFIERDGRARVVAEAGDGLEAVRLIEAESPDLVFLDIQMPAMDGFEVIAALDMEVLPRIVFVTAHDRHALRAFEVRALDYLLKPVDRERFADALDRALEHVALPRSTAQDARGVLAELPTERRPLERFLVRSRGRMQLIAADRVDWIGGAGNYAELHANGDTHLVRGTLAEIEARLPAERFVRIHRSAIVNLDRVKALHPWSHGDLMIELSDGTELRLSRRYRGRLEGIFGL